jgi:hypothetical protein
MPAGVTEIIYTYQGTGVYVVTLLDEHSRPVEQIAAGSGKTSATKKVEVRTAGKYSFQIDAAAPWEITVRYPDDGVTSTR